MAFFLFVFLLMTVAGGVVFGWMLRDSRTRSDAIDPREARRVEARAAD